MTEVPSPVPSPLTPEPLFAEQGASWAWVLTGPAAAVAMLMVEINLGMGPQPVVPLIFLVLVSGFVALQVKAARIHTSVELTPHWLRQGTEKVDVANIVRVLPEPDKTPGARPPKWQSARALGELTAVPRGRTGVGIRLTEGRTAQAWARRHRDLRAALNDLVEQRESENP